MIIGRKLLQEGAGATYGSLQRLNILVLSLILEQLFVSEPLAIFSVASTCRRLYMLAVPFIYRRVCLHERSKTCEYLLKRLAKDSSRITIFIKDLVITPGFFLDDNTLPLVVQLLSKATCLEELSWLGTYNVPEVILTTLEQSCPKAKLNVKGQIYYSGRAQQPQDTGFSSLRLHSLTSVIHNEPNAQRTAKLCLFKILKSCPNLRKLIIDEQRGGCVVYAWEPDMQVDLDVQPGDHLPQLEELSFPLFAIKDMIAWRNKSGWTNLRTLKVNNCSILQAFTGHVPCLRSITAHVTWSDLQTRIGYFSHLGPLEELILKGKEMCFPFNIIGEYSGTLTSLVVHAPEPYDPARRPDIPIAELQQLNATCPKLENLSIDMNRDGEWPYEYLKEIAKFSALRHLTLTAEGRRGGKSRVLPIIDQDSIQHLFEFLCGHKAGQPLLTLTVERGGMASWGYGSPRRRVIEEQKYQACFTCRLDASKEIAVTQKGGSARRALPRPTRRQQESWDERRWTGMFKGYDEHELEVFAALLGCDWGNLQSPPNIKGLFNEAEMSDKEKGTAMRILFLQEASDEKRQDCKKELEEERVKARRKRLMEEALDDFVTLYDILRDGK